MHFTVTANHYLTKLIIQIDKGSADLRKKLIESYVGFNERGELFSTGDNLYYAMTMISNFVENELKDECTFEVC